MTLTIEQQYFHALEDLLTKGKRKAIFNAELGKEDDTQYVLSLLGRTFHHDMAEGFPLYTSKFVYWKGAIAEMLWFLSGSSDLAMLQGMGVYIWDKWGERKGHNNLKLHYSNMTNWDGIDQTRWVLESLPKHPYRKSYVVTYLDPSTTYKMAEQAGKESVDIVACHYQHHLLCQEEGRLSLTVSIRSQDMFLGHPFNVAQYAALLQMYCVCLTNRTGSPWTPDEFVLNCTGDYHIYSTHIEQCQQQMIKPLHPFPQLHIKNRGQTDLQHFVLDDFELQNYTHGGSIKADVYVAGGKA